MYFLEGQIAKHALPAITHPEFYCGFTGVTLVWQFENLLIGSEPERYRPVMLAALASSMFGISMVDWIFVILSWASYARTAEKTS